MDRSKEIIIIVLFYISFATLVFLQTKTNVDLFEENISGELEEFIFRPGFDRDKQFIFYISSDENVKENDEVKSFLQKVIKKTLTENNLRFALAEDLTDINDSLNNIKIVYQTLEVKYPGFRNNPFLGDKTINRSIKINLTFIKDSIVQKKLKVNKTDEIKFDDLNKLESEQYSFTRSRHPEISTFEEIIFPVALIGASAAAIILFFFVRTN